MKHFLFLMLITLGTSCSNSIEIEQPDYERKVVVDGWIESDDFAHVFLTYSSPFLTEYDSTSIRQSFLNNAKVTILASNGESEVLTVITSYSIHYTKLYDKLKTTPYLS